MRMFTHTEHTAVKTGADRKARLVTHKTKHCPNVKICPTPVKGWEKLWETPFFREFQWQEAGTSLHTTIKGEAKSKPRGLSLVIDQSSSIYYYKYNTRRPLGATPDCPVLLEGPGCALSAQSYAVAFHCILINTCWTKRERLFSYLGIKEHDNGFNEMTCMLFFVIMMMILFIRNPLS